MELSAVWGAVCALGLVIMAGLIGAATLAWGFRGASAEASAAPSRLERPLICVGLGLGLLSYVPLLLGASRILTPMGVRSALGILLVAALLFGLRAVVGWDRRDRETRGHPAWAWAVAGVGSAYLALSFVSCLTPMEDHDGLAYHVYAPWRWLQLGTMSHLPTHIHTQWPMGVEMLFALLLPVAGDSACKPLVGLFAALAAAATYLLGARLGSRTAGLVAAALIPLRAGAPSINTTSVEAALTFHVVMAAVALAAWRESRKVRARRAWFLMAVAFAGFACCTKLNGLLLAGFLGLAAAALMPPGTAPRARGMVAAGLVVGAVLTASPWYLRCWVQTGNPVYPFAYDLLGGEHWSRNASSVLAAYFHTFDTPGDSVAARHYAVVRHVWRTVTLALMALLLPGPRWSRGFIAGSAAFAIVQMWAAHVHRFLLPASPFAALVAAWWLVAVAGSRSEARARLSGLMAPLGARAEQVVSRAPGALLGWGAAAVIAAAYLPGAFFGAAASLPLAVGAVPKEAVRQRYMNQYAAFGWANSHLPARARVLYGPDNRVLFLKRVVYCSSAIYQRRIVYETPGAFRDSVRREGISHLILNRRLYANPADAFEHRAGWRAPERARLEELAARSQRIWEGDGVSVYRLGE